MKKMLLVLLGLLLSINMVYAENVIVTQTQETDIICKIDGLFVESYAINGFMYLPVDILPEYGFNLDRNSDGIELERKKIVYFDGNYDEVKTNSGLPVYKNSTPITIGGKITNTYLVENIIVIQADELLAFGDVTWDENERTVFVSIIAYELMNAHENAQDKIRDEEGEIHFFGQQKNGNWNGIVQTSVFQGMTYYGYMEDGEYEGVVFGYREHKPFLAALYELKTVRKGLKNGYCRYSRGYNNRPEPPQAIKMASGIYENDKLKNGEYTIYTDYGWNSTATFKVENFNEQIISSTLSGYYEHERSFSQVFYNGDLIEFDVVPVIESDRILIPLRGLVEKMGAVVEWDGQNQTAIVTKDDMILSVKIDHYGAIVNGACKYMDVPARLVDDRTMIPLRFLSEELGYTVVWNDKDNSIIVQ